MSADLYENTFYRVEKELSKIGPAWVHKLRMAGLEMFKAKGFPSLRDEEWRFYTGVLLAAAAAIVVLNLLAGVDGGGERARDGLAAVGGAQNQELAGAEQSEEDRDQRQEETDQAAHDQGAEQPADDPAEHGQHALLAVAIDRVAAAPAGGEELGL